MPPSQKKADRDDRLARIAGLMEEYRARHADLEAYVQEANDRLCRARAGAGARLVVDRIPRRAARKPDR
jgi:hypothetical protein